MDASHAALDALIRAARTRPPAAGAEDLDETALLQAVVDAAALLFEAQAASIALLEREPERLEFRVAAGAQGAGVVGLSVAPTSGIAGYVFSTGEALALSDVSSDPRFDRATAERTGYVPRAIAAVPLSVGETTVGVLQVLDKHAAPTFSLRDMTLLGTFASQAAVAIKATRTAHDAVRLLRAVLASAGGSAPGVPGGSDVDDLDAIYRPAIEGLDREGERPVWRLADRLASLHERPERERVLVADILAVVARHGASLTVRRRRLP